jgi:membrane protease YdiL (CAAX protease family)
MDTTAVRSKARVIPGWQVALVIVTFPALYMANSFTPWSRNFFADANYEGWLQFWMSAFVLWWTSVAAAVVVMRRHGWTLRDVGIELDAKGRSTFVSAAVGIGLGAVLIRQFVGPLPIVEDLVKGWSEHGAPHTGAQRLMWVGFGVVSAAFCEEFVYRGFGFHALRSRGMRVGVAAVLASLAWIGVHGLGAVYGFPLYAFWALVLTGLLVRTRSLVPSLIVHVAIHTFVILGS